MAVVKVNFTTTDEIKSWYKEEAEKQGLTMSGLMSFVLAQYKKNEESRQVLAELNQANKNIDLSFLDDIKEFMDLVKDKAEEESYAEIRDRLSGK